GQAVTDADGAFALPVDFSLETEAAQVTAVVGGSIASTRVELDANSETIVLAPLVVAPTTTCQPSWLPTFGGYPGIGQPDLQDWVSVVAVLDAGNGPTLYAGGYFEIAGGVPVNYVAKWTGANWSPVGGILVGGAPTLVSAFAVFDDGTG